MLKKNDIINIKIEDLTNLGFGVGRHEGAVVFTQDTVPGDVCEIKIILAKGSYYIGKLLKIITPSDIRYSGRCQISGCKSCAYKNISYENELILKKKIIEGAFIREGLENVEIKDVIPSPVSHNYRNKAQYPIQMNKDGEYVIGFYTPKSHRVCEASECPLLPLVFSEIISTLKGYFKKHNISVYDEDSERGLLRHIYLRQGEISGEILLTLVINGSSLPAEKELVALITEKFANIVGILINRNEKKTNVILGDEYRTLFGRDYIYDTLAGVKLKITAPSFYQVNHSATELLYGKARELAALTGDEVLLDLFCGAGSIGLSMANDARELIGIEIIDSAVKCATENAKLGGINHAKFCTGDASNTEKLLSRAETELGRKISPDVIILDPPRGGCDERLINFAANLSPKRIVYISCNPATLARDCKMFKTLGYSTDKVFGYDLFPMTGHVESVVCLTRE